MQKLPEKNENKLKRGRGWKIKNNFFKKKSLRLLPQRHKKVFFRFRLSRVRRVELSGVESGPGVRFGGVDLSRVNLPTHYLIKVLKEERLKGVIFIPNARLKSVTLVQLPTTGWLARRKSLLQNGPTPASFSFILGLFKQTIHFLQQINVKKCQFHPVCSTRIRTYDL